MKEIRNNETLTLIDSDKRIIEGYAIVFNSRSLLLRKDGISFYEEIKPDAINNEILNNSDIYFLLDHNLQRGVLARSNKGTGSLNLSIDERGLKFSFEVPNTALGNEVIEGIKRNDINGCSFAFTVEDDVFQRNADGTLLRTINKIDRLFDCSVVYIAAYPETTVDLRGFETFLNDSKRENNEDNIIVPMKREKRTEDEKETQKKELTDLNENDVKEKEEVSFDEDENDKEDEKEENSLEETETDNEEKEENNSDDEKENQDEKRNLNNSNIRNNHKNMNKEFSLLKTINSIANNRSIDEVAERVIAEGRSAADKAGVTTNGQIQIPLEVEKRFEGTPNGILASQNVEAVTYGGEAVPTETYDILGALRDRLIVSQLGAKMLNLSGNVEIPIYDGANCTWESEISEAKDGSGKFKTVKLTPKRLTAYLPISKQFLIQTSASAEALLRQDLIDCIAEKLQQTMFGNGVGSDVEPQGLFNGVVAESGAFKFEDAVAMEEMLELNNVYGEKKYVVSPATKAILRTTPIDKGSGRMVMENNEVLGIPAYSTSSVTGKGIILGDWSNLYIANFGALDLTVDTVTRARNAQIVLVVNMWVDYAVVRPEAFVKKILG